MIFINPWASYHSDDIPDLNPQDDEEAIGCICGACGYIIASAIFVWLMHFIFILINCIIIYPILTICLMKLLFKIGDKIYKRKD